MTITLEQIDALRERANVSYKEAKDALEASGGDMVEALLRLEQENKINGKKTKASSQKQGPGFMDTLKGFFRKMNRIRFILKNDQTTLLNLPLTVALLLLLFATPFVVVGLLIALFAGYRIQFRNESGKELAVNKYFDKMSDTVQDLASENKDR